MKTYLYQHTQSARSTALLSLIVPTLAAAALSVFFPPARLLGVICFCLLLLATILFCRLTITVTADSLIWSFGFGILRWQALLESIVEVERVPSRWTDGWGIHWTARGWLYNISGYDAVEIRLRNGKRFRLGSDKPDELLEAVGHARTFHKA